jgi:hypothetical protein
MRIGFVTSGDDLLGSARDIFRHRSAKRGKKN